MNFDRKITEEAERFIRIYDLNDSEKLIEMASRNINSYIYKHSAAPDLAVLKRALYYLEKAL